MNNSVISMVIYCCTGVGVAQLGGYLFAVGGHDGSNYLNSVEAYNPITDRSVNNIYYSQTNDTRRLIG